MKTFVASFNGHWIGGHGVIVANDLDQAKRLLAEKLDGLRLKQPTDSQQDFEVITPQTEE